MVLFTSNRDLERAENLRAVYQAYDGKKKFSKFSDIEGLHFGKYSLQVTDELPEYTCGKCLFIGHGMGAGKTYGLDQPKPYFKKSSLVTCATASSKSMVKIVAKQIGIDPEQVIPVGMPRTDAYFRHKPEHSQTKTYLYAPTYRGGDWIPDWNRIKPDPDELLIVKPHMVTGKLVRQYYRGIREEKSRKPSVKYLMECDVLITDYSSIMFDAFVLRKPVVLFAKDKEFYLSNRGMYFDYPESYSEQFCSKEEELLSTVRKAEWSDRLESLRDFYAGACDGHSTERVVEIIRSMI